MKVTVASIFDCFKLGIFLEKLFLYQVSPLVIFL